MLQLIYPNYLIDVSKFSYTFAFLIISFAPTDVAIILSFGNEGFGLTIDRLLKLKFFKALAQAPIFSDLVEVCVK